jgi:hypothetical protein
MEIIDRCLEKNPAHRFQNVAELARALSPLFTGGIVAADMVAGSYSQPVPPTLLGLERSGAMQVADTQPPIQVRKSAPVPASTGFGLTSTSLASGESISEMPQQGGRKWMWITAGIATIALGVGIGVVVGMGGEHTGNAAAAKLPTESVVQPADPKPAAPKPDVQPIDPPPPPPPPVQTTEKPADPPPPPKIEVKKPAVATVKKQPAKAVVKKPAGPNDKRTPVEPPDYTKEQKKPPVPDEPQKDPVKDPNKKPTPTPCAPNDPRCGL